MGGLERGQVESSGDHSRGLAVGPTRILGIDPGSRVVGWAIIECGPASRPARGPRSVAPLARRVSNLQAAGSGASRVGPARFVVADGERLSGQTVAARLASIGSLLERILAEYRPDRVAIEEAFYGKSIQSALRLGEARGVVLAAAHRAGLAIDQFTPARIKRCVTGHGRADKQQVAAFVSRALGLSSPPAGGLDATDALAVAWTAFEELRVPAVFGQSRSPANQLPKR